MNHPISIDKLPHTEHAGDWHDAPLKWIVRCNEGHQKFSTKKEAALFAKLRRQSNSLNEAIAKFINQSI